MSLRRMALAVALLLTATWIGSVAAAEEVPIVPTDKGDSVRGLLYARPFTLEVPYTYTWSLEQAPIRSGFILVLEVDPDMAIPRNTWTPVLYVGTRPAEITNVGMESGRMVVLVPGDTDLRTAPAYFGSVELPERVDAARGAQELAEARMMGIRPFSQETVDAALVAGGEALRAVSIDDVYRAVAPVILTYSPNEKEKAEGYLLIPPGR